MEKEEAQKKNVLARGTQSAVTVEKVPKRQKGKYYVPAKTRAPKRTSPELPVLCILSKSPTSGIRTHLVLREVREKWFPGLNAEDLSAVYPESKKNIVDTVVKFARKHLVEKGQVHAPGEETPVGTWRITSSGMERTLKEQGGSWHPMYVEVHSLVEGEADVGEQKEDDASTRADASASVA